MSQDLSKMRSVVVSLGDRSAPWWLRQVGQDRDLCKLDVHNIDFKNKRSKQVTALELPHFLMRALGDYRRLRLKYDYIFTFECSLPTFAFAFWQTVLMERQPKHVVLQFIMREKSDSWPSRLKYALMRWCFSSLHMVVCSSDDEAAYYRELFRWPSPMTAFVPMHTSANLLDEEAVEGGYIFAAGRAFRDFPTLLEALRGTDHPTTIVASRQAVSITDRDTSVRLLEDIGIDEFRQLMRAASVVVVPLQPRRISTGQLVLLHAMALGKPVIATRTAGTTDYIRHGENGLLVTPNDATELRAAVDRLMADGHLRAKLGNAARADIVNKHLPHHYSRMVRARLLARNSRLCSPRATATT